MKTLAIRRLEGTYAICEDSEQKLFAIELAELPQEAAPGSIIDINNEGVITVNKEKTAELRAKGKTKKG